MSAEVTTIYQAMGVTNVGRVTQTPIEQDSVSGLFIREIRVYEDTAVSDNLVPVFTLRLSSATSEGLNLTTPNLKF